MGRRVVVGVRINCRSEREQAKSFGNGGVSSVNLDHLRACLANSLRAKQTGLKGNEAR